MSRNLNNRIHRLEHTLEALPCTCPNSAELAWPGHQPNPNCPTCGGERLIYPLPHHRDAEPRIRQALPILRKAYGTSTTPTSAPSPTTNSTKSKPRSKPSNKPVRQTRAHPTSKAERS